MAEDIQTHEACPTDGSCTTCSACSSGLCPGTLFAGAILIGWLVFLGVSKLTGKKKSPPPQDE
ncbi:hypothetical protein [Coraliomargarita akajimensis]|uniref:Znc transporter n=1 Tax=Coraliomargarita akajimensis (strain DSM 45221 / IAM 15411 / JCM 23193 / KCTC 12865 / 04OKA010-24) TaxID=583355 RepID=D5EIW0_CORAD|nr:hypothetical protein [Coraliomargarita akajimensis]ADE54359.1 znc transporter [Coraliomargarita akajimensis DSM 45221]